MSQLFTISEEELQSEAWRSVREACEKYGWDIQELAANHARFRMIRAEFRAKALAEQAAKNNRPPIAPAPATLVHFNQVRQFWDARNQRWTKPGIVYIGRAMPHLNLNLPASPFGNPYRIEQDTDELREDAIELYANWIHLPAQAHLMPLLDELRGQILACWCYPKHCHGEVLIQLLREREENAAQKLQGAAPGTAVEAGAAASEASAARQAAEMDSASQPHRVAQESQRQPPLQMEPF